MHISLTYEWQNQIHLTGSLVGIWNWEANREDAAIIIADFVKKTRGRRVKQRIIKVLAAGTIIDLGPHDIFELGKAKPIIPF
jgi:hypothetical protein